MPEVMKLIFYANKNTEKIDNVIEFFFDKNSFWNFHLSSMGPNKVAAGEVPEELSSRDNGQTRVWSEAESFAKK